MIKYKMFMIVIFVVIVFSVSQVYALIFNSSLHGKVIYIDAGHGGVDSGAIVLNFREEDINLVLAKKLEVELVKRGAIVYLTREGDYDLADTTRGRKRSDLANRARLINNSNCDMYISIHLNYIVSSKWKGLQIFYNNKNVENINIAKKLTDYLKKNIVNVRDYKYSNEYYMYRLIQRPGVLIEMGFLSNPDDRYRLTKDIYQDELINNIVNSLEYYYDT